MNSNVVGDNLVGDYTRMYRNANQCKREQRTALVSMSMGIANEIVSSAFVSDLNDMGLIR